MLEYSVMVMRVNLQKGVFRSSQDIKVWRERYQEPLRVSIVGGEGLSSLGLEGPPQKESVL